VSTGHIVTTSPLRFHLTLFVRTHEEDAELSFIFEADDVYAAADKLTQSSDVQANLRAFSIGKSSPWFKLRRAFSD